MGQPRRADGRNAPSEEFIRVPQTLKRRALWTAGGIFAVFWLAAFLACFAYATSSMAGTPTPSTSSASPTGVVTKPKVKCHTVTPETYNRQVRKLDRITPKRNGKPRHRATRKVCKWTKYQPLVDHIAELCRPSEIVSGKVSWFNDSVTATGKSAATHQGLAINLWPGTDVGYNNATTQGWVRDVRAGKPPTILFKLNGRSKYTTIVDTGPAGSTDRALDVSMPLVWAMGWNMFTFPTDAWGSAYLIRPGCR